MNQLPENILRTQYANTRGIDLPDGSVPCWYVSAAEKDSFLKNGLSYLNTTEYFKVVRRSIDAVEGFLGRLDRNPSFFEGPERGLTYFDAYKFMRICILALTKLLGSKWSPFCRESRYSLF